MISMQIALLPRFIFSAVAAAASIGCLQSHAALVTYDIDETLSGLTLSGTFSGQTIVEQSPGSLFNFWDGTITGDLVGNTLSFSGGSSVVALANPTGPFGPAGFGVDNYAGQVPAFLAVAASRDMAFDITSGSVTHGVSAGGLIFDDGAVGKVGLFCPACD